MSIVGPRPERQFFLDTILEHVPRYNQLQKLRPGITSLGQIRYGYADSIDQMKLRARYDLVYLDNVSLLTDIKIILYTIIVVVKGKGK
jgi:lipopolysaccharide/colanic/teichoic acid biosynthesis glycosyltransferase